MYWLKLLTCCLVQFKVCVPSGLYAYKGVNGVRCVIGNSATCNVTFCISCACARWQCRRISCKCAIGDHGEYHDEGQYPSDGSGGISSFKTLHNFSFLSLFFLLAKISARGHDLRVFFTYLSYITPFVSYPLHEYRS